MERGVFVKQERGGQKERKWGQQEIGGQKAHQQSGVEVDLATIGVCEILGFLDLGSWHREIVDLSHMHHKLPDKWKVNIIVWKATDLPVASQNLNLVDQ